MIRTQQKTQRQLHIDYQKDRFVRDHLVKSADIPDIERSLREKVASAAQEAQRRIASVLSNIPGSAGSTAHKSYALEQEDANYGIGRRFGNGLRKNRMSQSREVEMIQSAGTKRDYDATAVGCAAPRTTLPATNTPKRTRAALGKLRSDRSYVSISSVEQILSAAYSGQEAEEHISTTDNGDGQDSSRLSISAKDFEEDKAAAVTMTNIAFLCSFEKMQDVEMSSMYAQLKHGENATAFRGLILDTGANRSSAVSLEQYRAYCRRFGVRSNIGSLSASHKIKVTCGSMEVIGTAIARVLFSELNVVLQNEFKLLCGNGPNLLSVKDMKGAKFQLYIQRNEL
jgi:hypothetical protein